MAQGARLTDADKAEILDMLEMGIAVQEIALELGIHETTVYKLRREAGYEGPVKDPLEGVDFDKVIEEYERGDRMQDITERHGLGSTTLIYKILATMGVPMRKYQKVLDAGWRRQLDEACALYEGGEMIRTIVKETGVPQPTLHKELHKRGIPLRQPRGVEYREEMRAGEDVQPPTTD